MGSDGVCGHLSWIGIGPMPELPDRQKPGLARLLYGVEKVRA